jgi:DNA-binding transcriptional ArsR family regulator
VSRKKLLESLLIDEEMVFERLVDKAKRLFGLNKRGEIIFLVPRESLTQRQLVAVYLIGGLFAKELEIKDTEIITAEELSLWMKMDKKTVTARLHDLKKEHIIESPERGRFSISISGADKILNEIINLK